MDRIQQCGHVAQLAKIMQQQPWYSLVQAWHSSYAGRSAEYTTPHRQQLTRSAVLKREPPCLSDSSDETGNTCPYQASLLAAPHTIHFVLDTVEDEMPTALRASAKLVRDCIVESNTASKTDVLLERPALNTQAEGLAASAQAFDDCASTMIELSELSVSARALSEANGLGDSNMDCRAADDVKLAAHGPVCIAIGLPTELPATIKPWAGHAAITVQSMVSLLESASSQVALPSLTVANLTKYLTTGGHVANSLTVLLQLLSEPSSPVGSISWWCELHGGLRLAYARTPLSIRNGAAHRLQQMMKQVSEAMPTSPQGLQSSSLVSGFKILLKIRNGASQPVILSVDSPQLHSAPFASAHILAGLLCWQEQPQGLADLLSLQQPAASCFGNVPVPTAHQVRGAFPF